MRKNKLESDEFIDNLLDNIEDPIVSETGSFGYIGFMESLILNALISCGEKTKLIANLDTMRKSEMDLLCIDLKENQNFRDPKDQLNDMFKKGVFMDFIDQN
tara:strand:- start:1133 stop:1438 length:306 start_codon:yes stop_codon:yes gene_type:complete